jgi:DNA-binding IclR family transcriptional regulator
VYGPRGDLAAVLSLTAPSIRLTRQRVEQLLPVVLRSAAAISAELGHLPGTAATARGQVGKGC